MGECGRKLAAFGSLHSIDYKTADEGPHATDHYRSRRCSTLFAQCCSPRRSMYWAAPGGGADAEDLRLLTGL